MNYQDNIISDSLSTKEALGKLNELQVKTLFIVNNKGKLVGTLTDGDIRRGLLQDKKITDSVMEFAEQAYTYLHENEISPESHKKLTDKKFYVVPVINDNKEIVSILNLKEYKSLLPVDAVVMAGGLGKRLRPLTEDTPKPMLKIGEKPIIEYNLDLLKSYGINNVGISVNYLKDKIINHYGDGEKRNQTFSYIHENQPLGTIGAVALMNEFVNDYILVMNSDLLTTINLEDMFTELIENNAEMIVATTEYKVNIPYGVIETHDGNITALKEKPTYSYYSNAGIYIFKKEHLNRIPKNKRYNATDLIQSLLDDNKQVINYPIRGYWLDIGKMRDYEKAQNDIDKINF
ncbi:MAG: NTP transferase domain-containing protein [Crocinitomicaceae bacterium]|nr:NTP transferase domain-containing protein [Crocinitomicaceae bacterium]